MQFTTYNVTVAVRTTHFYKNELLMYCMPLYTHSSLQYFFGVLSRRCPGKG